MKKTLIAVVITVVCVAILFTFVRNEFIDKFNPFLEMEHSYAKVEKGTQNYENVTVYNKNGEKLSYKLSFNGFDPHQEYVDVLHKGKYVKEIHYIKSLPDFKKWGDSVVEFRKRSSS